jgi:hypothetical protein
MSGRLARNQGKRLRKAGWVFTKAGWIAPGGVAQPVSIRAAVKILKSPALEGRLG